MRLALLAAALAVTGVLALAQQAPLDYPQWRGRDRDSSASGFVAPRVWPQTLTKRWRVEVGEGYSTPIVVGDAVYVFTRQGSDEVMTALDAATGAAHWQTRYPAPYSPSQPAAAHGAGPKATPLYHEGRLFTLGISGIVSAFDATGRLLWQSAPPVEAPFYGAASSPLGEGALVIVHPGDYGPLTAFDARTGERKWTAGAGGFFASPVAATLAGVRQVVTATQDSIIGVALDGRVLWRHPWPGGGEGSTTPTLANDVVVVGTGRTGTVGLRPALRNGEWAVETVWTAGAITLYTSDTVVANGAVFGLTTRDKGRFFALDVETGTMLWQGEPREADHTAIVKSGELLFLLNDDAELIVARASRTAFDPLARYTVASSATWAQPLISGNRVFIKDVSSLTLWTLD